MSGARLWDAPDRDCEDDEGEREIDEEDPAPRQVLNEPSPEHGTERSRNRGEPGPCPYCSTALCLRKRRTDERQAARNEQRGAHTLQGASRNELTNSSGKAAPRGRGGEDEHAASKDFAAASKIAQRSAGQEQRSQRQRIGFDNPLNLGQRRVESRLQRRKGHVHDGAIDERQTRSENGGREHPTAPAIWVRSATPVRIAASSHGGLAMTAIIRCERYQPASTIRSACALQPGSSVGVAISPWPANASINVGHEDPCSHHSRSEVTKFPLCPCCPDTTSVCCSALVLTH